MSVEDSWDFRKAVWINVVTWKTFQFSDGDVPDTRESGVVHLEAEHKIQVLCPVAPNLLGLRPWEPEAMVRE